MRHLLIRTHCPGTEDFLISGLNHSSEVFAILWVLAIPIILNAAAAGLWLKRREELEFPLGAASDLQPPRPAQLQGTLSSEPADLVVEIGCEELPPADATSAIIQLR